MNNETIAMKAENNVGHLLTMIENFRFTQKLKGLNIPREPLIDLGTSRNHQYKPRTKIHTSFNDPIKNFNA